MKCPPLHPLARPFPVGRNRIMQRSFLFLFTGLIALCCAAPPAHAAPATLTLRYRHHLFTLSASDVGAWRMQEEQWIYRGRRITPPQELRAEGDTMPTLPPGMAREMRETWDLSRIARAIEERVPLPLLGEPGSVTIRRSASGGIAFEGVGFPGRSIDLPAAALLVKEALEQGVTDITLPVVETPPRVTVLDDALRAQGIRELVTIGESDFQGSTGNRIHNIETGLQRFNGHVIPKDTVFSFVEVLGPVNASTGYRKELTILGDKTLPDYGGGLCQVSSTAYRGVWEYGFPILQRKNHSFAVHYYAPQGTDATIYPPNVDIKFRNDGPSALLIQTWIDVAEKKAYFLYYGTKDDRTASVIGPYTWGHTSPPPPRTEETTEIPPGTKRKVGDAVPGMHAAWFRIVHQNGEERVERVSSIYEARPLFYQIGVESVSTGSGLLSQPPSDEAILSD